MNPAIINLAYVVASVLFILGLKGLSHPRTAVRGNLLAAVGMLIAVLAVLTDRRLFESAPLSFGLILSAMVLGGLVGSVLAVKIQMTAMPQMVAVFNGFGGIASALVAGAALLEEATPGAQFLIATAISGWIGAVTFWGSLVAFAKLQEFKFMPGGQISFAGQKFVNLLLALVVLGLAVWLVVEPGNTLPYWLLLAVASLMGLLLVLPIGGADMPVVIALLNSYSGLAAAATGFVLSNNVLIIAGSLVGASGLILTRIMCKAMNRSLTNVIFSSFGPALDGPSADDVYAGKVKSTSSDEVAMMLDTARRVVIVPGYGMAVAQCQHAVRDLTNILESRGVSVEFGIHPVAGRMPGHMNVLLAEANISYDKLIEMDSINPTMDTVDVAIVIGANDVVNPVARTDPKSPIAGMPIIEVDKARTCIVIKRSLSPGFAGIPNPLFAADNTLMLFGDGKKAVMDMVASLKEN